MSELKANLKVLYQVQKNRTQAIRLYKNSKDMREKYNFLRKIAQDTMKNIGIKVELVNDHYVKDISGSILLSNHQDNFDIFVLVEAMISPISFVAKKELFKIPLFKTYIKMSGSYELDRENPRQGLKVLKEVVFDVDKDGVNVLIFPEGTRSQASLMSEFKGGMFSVIRKTAKPIIPIYIDHSLLGNKRTTKVIFGEPIDLENFPGIKAGDLKKLVYERICALKKEYTNQKQYSIIGLGDSLTFGENCKEQYTGGYFSMFKDKLSKEGNLKEAYNFALPSYSTEDVLNLIANDNYEQELNKKLNRSYEITENIDYIEQAKTMPSLTSAIKKVDFIFITVGANDILQSIGKLKPEIKDLYDSFDHTVANNEKLINCLIKLNPSVKIFFFGLYFPFPHSKAISKYDKIEVLDCQLNKMFSKYNNVSFINVSFDIAKNKEIFLPNKRNIHLSDEGYHYFYERLIATFQKTTSF